MKKILTTLVLSCALLLSYAQSKKINIEISRDDYNEIEIVSDNEKFILTSTQKTLAHAGDRYELDRGKGGQKDINGHRERNKLYFKNAQNDTLATLLKKEDQIIIGNRVLSRKKNANGWEYLAKDSTKYASINLFWNKTKWKYSLAFHQNDKVAHILEKAIMLSLVDFAIEESHCDDDDSLESLPHILYFLSLLAN